MANLINLLMEEVLDEHGGAHRKYLQNLVDTYEKPGKEELQKSKVYEKNGYKAKADQHLSKAQEHGKNIKASYEKNMGYKPQQGKNPNFPSVVLQKMKERSGAAGRGIKATFKENLPEQKEDKLANKQPGKFLKMQQDMRKPIAASAIELDEYAISEATEFESFFDQF